MHKGGGSKCGPPKLLKAFVVMGEWPTCLRYNKALPNYCTMYIQAAKKSSFPQNTRKAGNEQSCTVLVC